MSQFDFIVVDEEINENKIVELANIYGLYVEKFETIVEGFENAQVFYIENNIISEGQWWHKHPCTSFDEYLEKRKLVQIEHAKELAANEEAMLAKGLCIPLDMWLPGRVDTINADWGATERKDFWLVKLLIEALIKEVTKIFLLSYMCGQNGDELDKVRGLKHSSVKLSEMKIETLAFLEYKTLLEVTR